MVNIDNLFKMISEKGITQSKLAENTSISTGNISDWKKGRSFPSAQKLDELATYFGCSVDYLLGRTDNSEIISTGKTTSTNYIQEQPDKTTTEFMQLFQSLDISDKIAVMNLALEKSKKA